MRVTLCLLLKRLSVYGGGVISEQTVRDVLGPIFPALLTMPQAFGSARHFFALYHGKLTLFEGGKDLLRLRRLAVRKSLHCHSCGR